MKRTAVLVTGSRSWGDWARIRERLSRYPRGTTLIHGAATGADTIAACIAHDLGFIIHAYPYFRDLGNSGGHARNRCMFGVLRLLQTSGYECFVEAFPRGEAKGTRGMIKLVTDNIDKIPLNIEEAA